MDHLMLGLFIGIITLQLSILGIVLVLCCRTRKQDNDDPKSALKGVTPVSEDEKSNEEKSSHQQRIFDILDAVRAAVYHTDNEDPEDKLTTVWQLILAIRDIPILHPPVLNDGFFRKTGKLTFPSTASYAKLMSDLEEFGKDIERKKKLEERGALCTCCHEKCGQAKWLELQKQKLEEAEKESATQE